MWAEGWRGKTRTAQCRLHVERVGLPALKAPRHRREFGGSRRGAGEVRWGWSARGRRGEKPLDGLGRADADAGHVCVCAAQGPFNMLNQVHDLNAALVSYAMMETSVFISSAGVIGPKKIVEHDVSLLVPEVWSVSPAG